MCSFCCWCLMLLSMSPIRSLIDPAFGLLFQDEFCFNDFTFQNCFSIGTTGLMFNIMANQPKKWPSQYVGLWQDKDPTPIFICVRMVNWSISTHTPTCIHYSSYNFSLHSTFLHTWVFFTFRLLVTFVSQNPFNFSLHSWSVSILLRVWIASSDSSQFEHVFF